MRILINNQMKLSNGRLFDFLHVLFSRKKCLMNEKYEENLIGPDDPNFQYDLPVDFPEQRETCGWDSDISDF